MHIGVLGRIGVLGVLVVAGLVGFGGRAQAPAAGQALQLTAGSVDIGWTSFALRGPAGAAVEVREQIGQTRTLVARVALGADGTAELRHAARWRCGRHTRHFIATTIGSGATASAAVTTPSCADRLEMIVAPGRLHPGRLAVVRVTDSWHLGAISASICANARSASAGCRKVRLARGRSETRTRVRVSTPGRWTIALRSRFGQRLARRLTVRRGARVRILVTGDSLTYGVFEVLGSQLKQRGGAVTGDPHPATGITTPLLAWPPHARQSARSVRPDATVVLLGSAQDSDPLVAPSGEAASCCDAAWIAEYSRRVREMMMSYLRGGRGLVYWVALPAPRDPKRVEFAAINTAIRDAASGFDDGVRVIEDVASVLSPGGQYEASIDYHGKRLVVRDPDGIHLAPDGVHIATAIISHALRRDGVVERLR